ncbi:SRPBCC family protein [Streptomyces sulfonofaciens]|uniref:SRPBCC family protein n=1 Tax=Streptomyces sulfonofaciens TaxID=68272 RepID=UPI0016720E99|nr:SRPBCC family protein [Streptomyces sulfonofaciens]
MDVQDGVVIGGGAVRGGGQSGVARDGVTGARVDVEGEFGVSPERLWDVLTDVTRIGEFSPECVGGAWVDEQRPGPRAGASFRGRNRFADDHVVEVHCVVTRAERPGAFAWVVLDRSEDPASPGSLWSYELRPGATPGSTLVRHSFEHGPGDTGARRQPEAFPERLEQLRAHMTRTLAAMAAAAA